MWLHELQPLNISTASIAGLYCGVPHRMCPYFDVLVGLARSYEPENYAGGGLATGKVSHARQVEGDGPDKKGHPRPPGWKSVMDRNSQAR